MKDQHIINNIVVPYVKSVLKNAEGGHDWLHINRVWKSSLQIAKEEANCDMLVVELGALLHDIADSKFHNGDETLGPAMAETFMKSIDIQKTQREHVIKIIENISFKGGNFQQAFKSPELDIVQDADRLDALGAIGIARTFNYGGFKDRKLYDPEIMPVYNMKKEAYKNSTAPTINHFYEKLLILKDKMNTKTGLKLAQERHDYMQEFVNRFLTEANLPLDHYLK